MEFRDYYATLGLKRGASEKEIRTAYRKLAREFHPDLRPNDKNAEKRFKEVNEAYEVLSDVEKRKKYDQLGANWRQYEQWQRAGGKGGGQPFDWADLFGAGSAPGGGPGGPRAGSHRRTINADDVETLIGGSGSSFSDFFQTFFGSARPADGSPRGRTAGGSSRTGRDIDQPVDISIEEAFTGATRLIEVTDQHARRPRRLEVKIPPGVSDGSRVRIAGQGGSGVLGGSSGDLYLVVRVVPSPLFSREGDDIRVKVPVSLTTAVLGGEVEVPTPKGGRLALKIPAGTQDGRLFRLRGQGLPQRNQPAARGDLLAEVHAQLPEHLSDKQRALFQQLADLERATVG